VIAMKEAGVSDHVIAAIVGKRSGSLEPLPSVPEIGIYYGIAGSWVDLKPDVVDWKTGGIVKHVASIGVVKGDVNGLVNGPSSPNVVRKPLEILV
jgi:hypothetical protein